MQVYDNIKFKMETSEYLKDKAIESADWAGVIHEGENDFIYCNQPPNPVRRQNLIGDFQGLNIFDRIIIEGVRGFDIKARRAKKEPMIFTVIVINNQREIEIAPRLITTGKYRNVDYLPKITHSIIKLSRNR